MIATKQYKFLDPKLTQKPKDGRKPAIFNFGQEVAKRPERYCPANSKRGQY
jgi:hypothetical protein